MRALLSASLVFAALTAPLFAAQDYCYECHLGLRGKLKGPSVLWANDVHNQSGLLCTACHKGDATINDQTTSKTTDFIGTFHRPQIARLCGDCHSNAAEIHKVNAKLPLDQLSQYQQSVHGQKMAAGEEAAATCIDCHSLHEIRKVSDPLSPVSAMLQPDTCGRCHANAELMAPRNQPFDSIDEYKQGGHWIRLTMRGQTKVARCTSCHGDHDVTPAKAKRNDMTCQPCHGDPDAVYQDRAHWRIDPAERVKGCVGCHNDHAVSRRPGGGRGGPGGRGNRGFPGRGW